MDVRGFFSGDFIVSFVFFDLGDRANHSGPGGHRRVGGWVFIGNRSAKKSAIGSGRRVGGCMRCRRVCWFTG